MMWRYRRSRIESGFERDITLDSTFESDRSIPLKILQEFPDAFFL